MTVASAQPVTWEPLPLFQPEFVVQRVGALDFHRGEGAQAGDPAADSLVVFAVDGTYLYNPSGDAGAAGSNGEGGAWHELFFARAEDGLVTDAGSLIMGATSQRICRGTGRGRTWACETAELYPFPLFASSLPALVGPDGAPALFAGVGDGGETARSVADGVPGSWVQAGTGLGYPQAFGEVPRRPRSRMAGSSWASGTGPSTPTTAG